VTTLALPTEPTMRTTNTAPSEDLVRAHLHATWRYLRMHGASATEADDLTQESFVIAAQKQALGLGGDEPQNRAELAAGLGLQENGIKTLMQRARQQLRECIDRRNHD
jgi:DNA-directed RNA polymerase specialized sigma24 family protein